MNFSIGFYDPFKLDMIEFGDVEKDKVMEMFEKIPWADYLAKMETAQESDIHHSPSFEIENKDNGTELSIDAIDDNEWEIFYERPKLVKKFFGLIEKEESHFSLAEEQTENDVRECLQAFIRSELQFLENKFAE